MSAMKILRVGAALSLSVFAVACGDSEGEGGRGGSNTGGTPSPVTGGSGGDGGEGGCTEITVELGQLSYDGEGGPTLLLGESSPSGDPERDVFNFILYPNSVGGITAGPRELGTGDDANYATCHTCFIVYEDLLNTRTYLASGGTATVDRASASGSVKVSLADVTLTEIEVDPETFQSTPVEGGRCLHLASGELDGLSHPEQCDDGVDNDHDDLVDCSDVDCSSTAACAAELAAACAGAATLTPGTPISASSADGSRLLTYDACEAGSFTGGGPEAIYVMTPAETGLAKIRLFTDVDMAIYVQGACGDPLTTVACSDSWGEFAESEWLNVPVQAGSPLYVVVDSYAESAPDGAYVLEASIDPFELGDRCDAVPPLPTADTRDYADLGPDVVLGSAAAACTGGTAGVGADAVYEVVLAAGQSVEVTVTPTGYGDPVLYLADACAPEIATCFAGVDAGSYGEAETLSFTSAAGGTYFLVVDSGSSTSLQYSFALTSMIQ